MEMIQDYFSGMLARLAFARSVLSNELLVDFPYIDLTGLFVLLQKLFGRR